MEYLPCVKPTMPRSAVVSSRRAYDAGALPQKSFANKSHPSSDSLARSLGNSSLFSCCRIPHLLWYPPWLQWQFCQLPICDTCPHAQWHFYLIPRVSLRAGRSVSFFTTSGKAQRLDPSLPSFPLKSLHMRAKPNIGQLVFLSEHVCSHLGSSLFRH